MDQFTPLPDPDPMPTLDGAGAVPASADAPAAADIHVPILRRGKWLLGEIVSGLQTLFSAAVYAAVIVTFGFQVARVDGHSMAPTLDDHDRLIVNKLVYSLGDPLPGDIVMLYYPVEPEKSFVKRIVAGPNDTIRIVDGRVYVRFSGTGEEVALPDEYIPEEYRLIETRGPEVVPVGYYYVMGDHRNNSSDSRSWGPVPKKYIIGKVQLRWWPVTEATIF
jgi:signal peptidase I